MSYIVYLALFVSMVFFALIFISMFSDTSEKWIIFNYIMSFVLIFVAMAMSSYASDNIEEYDAMIQADVFELSVLPAYDEDEKLILIQTKDISDKLALEVIEAKDFKSFELYVEFRHGLSDKDYQAKKQDIIEKHEFWYFYEQK